MSIVASRKGLTNRNCLAKHKVPEFVEWLRARGWEKVETKGPWEMVRMCDPVGRLLLIFDKRTKEHTTIQNEYVHLIEEWLNDR